MAIDSRIALALQPLNIGQRMGQNLQNLQAMDLLQQRRTQAPFQNQLLQLQTELTQAQQPGRLQDIELATSPIAQATAAQEQFNQFDISSAQALKPVLDAGDRVGVISALTKQRENAVNFGLPQSEVDEIDQAIQLANNPEGLQQLKQVTDSFLQSAGVTPRTTAQTASQRDFKTFKDLERQAKLTPEADDDIAAQQFGRQAGFVRPTEQEKADIKVSESERKEVAKANAKRKQGFIDAGVEAADSVANIKRSIGLLEGVKTGGIDQAKFRIRQAFGVEGADEGELSANLGRSVLAQLKPIFGAAFTAAEGERLERIEAGFGRSPDTNKRLLNSALRIAQRASRRGLSAAEDQGDEFTANEIREAMAFKFEDPTEAPEQPLASSQFQEGQTATNPQTGERLVFRNGNWEAL